MIYLAAGIILLGSWFLPWWWVALVTGWVGYKSKSLGQALGLGFLSVAVTWVPVAYYFDLQSHGLISQRLSGLFTLPWTPLAFLLVALVGGIYGALGGATGFQLRALNHGPHESQAG